MIPSPGWFIFGIVVEFLIIVFLFLIPVGVISGIVFIFVRKGEADLAKKSLYKKIMIWSFAGPLVGLFLILSIWGLVYVLSQTFG